MIEIWKDIKGFEGLYKISNLGNVKSVERTILRKNGRTLYVKEKILKPSFSNNYAEVSLSKNNTQTRLMIHKLMCEIFLNCKTSGRMIVVNHINFNKRDNTLENLEIITARKNSDKKHIPSSSKYVGVCLKIDKRRKKTGRWVARIFINGKSKHLGYHDTEWDAHLAYQKSLKKHNLTIN